MGRIVEDYSDLAVEEGDEWQEKFADFKMKTSVRRGLFHPDDIKTVGLAPPSPGPKTAPLPDLGVGRAPPRQQSPVLPSSASASPFVAPPSQLSVRSHSHSPSLAGSSSGSFGKSDTRRLASSEFNKYAEDDDEDYDDVFGKPNGSCARFSFFCLLLSRYARLTLLCVSITALEHPMQTLQLNTRLSNKSWVRFIDGSSLAARAR
jgi:hypothetical protein